MSQCWRRTRHLPSFFVPTPGDLTTQYSPPSGICHPRQKNANACGQPGGGGVGGGSDRRSWNWLMHKAISLLFCFALFLLGMKTLLKLGVNEWNQAIGIIFNWVWRSLQKHPFLLAKEKRMFSQARCDETGHKSESSPKITRSIDRQTQENRYIKKKALNVY